MTKGCASCILSSVRRPGGRSIQGAGAGLGNLVIDGLNGFICDLTPESLAQGIRRALEARRLPTGPTLESFRESLGKPRWERLRKWLELE